MVGVARLGKRALRRGQRAGMGIPEIVSVGKFVGVMYNAVAGPGVKLMGRHHRVSARFFQSTRVQLKYNQNRDSFEWATNRSYPFYFHYGAHERLY